MHDLVEWLAIHWKWLLSSGVIAGVGGLILKGPETLERWGRFYRKARRLPDSPYLVPAAAFGTDVNPRFGFSFAYPRKWDRSDPDNSDGSLYRNPTYPSVEVSAYGCYPVVWPTLDEWIGASLHAPHITLLTKVDSGRYLVRGSGGVRTREKISGVRVVYDSKDARATYRAMQLFVQSEVQVGVLCKAPKRLFGSFEQVFLHVCDSLELLEPIFYISTEQKRRRRDAIWEMLKPLRPAEAVKTSGVYAGLLSIHPELVLDITQQELQGELLEMKERGLIYYDPIVGGWSCYNSGGS